MARNRWACAVRGKYPEDWAEIATRAKEAAGWVCEHCGMAFDSTGRALDHLNADGKPAVLTVHHLDGDKSNCTHANLLVCCQACHLHIQGCWAPGMELPKDWWPVPSWIVERGLDFRESRQTHFLEMCG